MQIGNFLQMLVSAFTDNPTPSANQVGADSNIKVCGAASWAAGQLAPACSP
jgi:hypothetical protein